MKKLFTTLAFVLMALTSHAQTCNCKTCENADDNKKYFYCDVSTDIGSVTSVVYDDGTVRGNSLLEDENGKKLKFNTDMSIVNYMTLQGWEIYIYNEHKTVFRKKVTEEEAKALLSKMTRKD